MTGWLRDAVQRSFAVPAGGLVERSTFGPLDAEQTVGALSAACEAAFGSPLDDGFLYQASVGVVGAMAYTARCEHAIDPAEEVWTTSRPRLREASALLA